MIFDNIYKAYSEFISESSGEVIMFCPYINVEALSKILSGFTSSRLSIITTWKTLDILNGISDLNLYPFCKKIGAYLYINQRIHLKVLIDSYKNAIVGSANITNKGLGLSPNSNYECITEYNGLDLYQQVYLRRIIQESVLMNDRLFEEFKHIVEDSRERYVKPLRFQDVNLEHSKDKDFLISSLPMSKSIDIFFEYYSGMKQKEGESDPDYDCAVHDLALYNLSCDLQKDQFVVRLKEEFFSQPFIKLLKEFISEPRNFGKIKEWVQDTCVDVPVPSRRDLTGNVQVLYKWFAELGKDEYEINRPHHTQRISPRKK